MFTRKFWSDTSERVVASVAGGALSVIGAGAFGVLDADWQTIASVALGTGVVSLLKALVASQVGDDSASLVSTPGDHAA